MTYKNFKYIYQINTKMKKVFYLGLALALFTACSSDDDLSSNVKIQKNGLEVTVPDASRVTNYKTQGTRTVTADVITALGFVTDMPEAPSVPAEARVLQGLQSWQMSAGSYVIAAEETFSGDLNMSNVDLYVAGTLNYSGGWGNGNIYILPGGTVNWNNTNAVQLKIHNWGTFNYTASNKEFYVQGQTGGFYCYGDMNLGNDVSFRLNNSKAYIGGDVICKNFNIEWNAVCYIAGDMTLDTDLTIQNNLAIRGKLQAPNISLINTAHLIADCTVITPGQFMINSNGDTAWLNHVIAGSIFVCANSSIFLEDGAFVEVAGDYTNLNNGNSASCILLGDNAKGVIKANRIGNNAGNGSSQVLYSFRTASDSEGAQLALDATEGIWFIDGGNNYANRIADENLDVMPNVYYTSDKLATFSMAPNCCSPGYNYNGGTEPNKPVIELISVIEPDHTHDISATCVQSLGDLNYISYHQRGVKQSGCIEIAQTKNNQTQLLQFLCDHNGDWDFNHLLIDDQSTPNRLFVAGNSSKHGGILAYINLTNEGLFEVSGPADTTIAHGQKGQAAPMRYIKLKAGSGGDGNCLIRTGNYLQVMTTAGYEVYNANTLARESFEAKPGKAKHINSDGTTIAASYLTERTTDEEAEIPVQVQTFAATDFTLSNPLSTIDAGFIQPNNGKNVVKVDGNRIYICLGRDGLKVIDNGVEKVYQPANIINDKGKYDGFCNGVAFDSKYLYVAYGTRGLIILDKETLKEVASYKCTQSANYINLSNGYIYVAYGRDRFQVFKLVDNN